MSQYFLPDIGYVILAKRDHELLIAMIGDKEKAIRA
jgi:hypothetical protein